ncbi:MAG: cobalt ECF transporter T component CbiQ [Dehalococcoidales bacterium]|nr:cobalt ECF transporter T component CbiQ [Dehalococcoidales bacterium]
MKHSFLDRYSNLDSFIHKLDPRTKFIIALVFILAVISTPPIRWQVFALYLFFMAALLLLSKLPIFYVLKRSLVVMPFVLMIAIFIPFIKEGEVAGSYNIGLWQVSVTYTGLQVLWNVLIKAWLSILSLIWLTSTTKLPNLLKGLEQLGMPRVMVMILSFMYRYIFVVVDEVMRMRQARDSRDFGGSRLCQLRTIGNMIGTLFIRSYERGERVYAAMLARGFDGHSRTLDRLNFSQADAYFGISFSLVLILTSVVNLLY